MMQCDFAITSSKTFFTLMRESAHYTQNDICGQIIEDLDDFFSH